MPRARRSALLLPLLVAACWHESPVPLGPSTEAGLDPLLAGLWELIDPDEGSVELEVMPFDDRAYYIEVRHREDEWPADSLEVLRLRGYITLLGGVPFMNLRDIQSAGPQPFSFVRYALSADTLTVRGVTDDVGGPFGTTEELRGALLAGIAADSLYDEPMRYRKVRGLLPNDETLGSSSSEPAIPDGTGGLLPDLHPAWNW